jgi:hypothetical protein
LKPTIQSVRGGGEHDVVLGDRADALGDHVEPHLRVLELRQLGDDGLDRADDVAAHHEVQVGDLARLECLVQALERDAAARADGRELLAAEPLAPLVRQVARLAVVGDDPRQLACRRRLVEAENLDRIAGNRAPLLALVVEQRLDPAVRVAATIASPTLSVPRWTSMVATAAPDVDPRLDDRARPPRSDSPSGPRAEVGDEHLLEQVVEVLLRLRRDLRELRRRPVLRLEVPCANCPRPGRRWSLRDRSCSRRRRSAPAARACDRLLRLRHHAVVGGDDGTAMSVTFAPRARMAVTPRDQAYREGDLAAIDVDLVGADVLRDAACLGGDDPRCGSRRAA